MSSGKEGSVKGKYESHTFEWKIHLNDDICNSRSFLAKVSQFFDFCGYYCQLYCNPKFSESMHYINIGLNGYPAPFYKNISSYYSISLISSKGKEQFTKQGRIHHFSEENINVGISDDFRVIDLTDANNYFSICFSWCEYDSCSKFKQGMLDEAFICDGFLPPHRKCVPNNDEMSSNVIESATQTEDSFFSHTRNICYNAASLNIEREAQTDLTQQSPEDICSCKDKENNKFLEILSKDFASFYDGKKDPDCVLKVDEIEFPIHRSMLAARSSVFEAMFHHDTSESRSGEVNIQDVDASVFGDVLYYIYSGKIRGLSPDTAASMYAVSDKYALTEDFRQKCLDTLKKNLTMENVCDAALLAHTHAETALESEVLKFIEERLEDLLQNDKWKNFSDTHFKLANRLLGLSFMASKKKRKDDTY